MKMCSRCKLHPVPEGRLLIGYSTCIYCGEIQARKVKHCIVPMHKSNYVLMTNLDDLKGINNKGGIVK
jgi:hypothetical protein